MSDVRVRFSPAPTGFMHIGNARVGPVQLAVRAPHGRHVHPAHRGHRRHPLDAGSDRPDPARAAVARPRLGRRSVPPEPPLRDVPRRRRPAGRRRATRTSASAPRTRSRSATTKRCKAGRKPGLRRSLPRPHAGRARRTPRSRGQPRSIRFRTPDDGRSTFDGRDPRRGVGRVVDDLRLRDRAIERHAGVLPRERGRRHRHGASRTCCAAKTSSTRPTACSRCAARSAPTTSPVYAHLPLIIGPGRRQALEAARCGDRSRSTATRAISRRRARELPRAARLGAGRRPRGPRRSTRWSPSSTSPASTTRPRRSTRRSSSG